MSERDRSGMESHERGSGAAVAVPPRERRSVGPATPRRGEPGEAVSVVIPAYNEEAAVRREVETVRAALEGAGLRHEIIVVDDGSTDRTASEAIAAGSRLIRHTRNRGYGASIKTGMRAARYNSIVITDADGTYPADEIPTLVEQLESADMVVGARTGSEVHVDLLRRPAKWMLGRVADRIAGQRIPDLNSGLRAFHRDTLEQYLPILSDRFSFTTTSTLALLADDYRIVYHPINYYQRIGNSKIVARHFMDFVFLVLRMSMIFDPLKLFVPLALTTGGLGFAKAIYDVIALFFRHETLGLYLLAEPVLSTSAMFAMLTGLQLLLIGMVADGLQRRIVQHRGPSVPSRWVSSVEHEPLPPEER